MAELTPSRLFDAAAAASLGFAFCLRPEPPPANEPPAVLVEQRKKLEGMLEQWLGELNAVHRAVEAEVDDLSPDVITAHDLEVRA